MAKLRTFNPHQYRDAIDIDLADGGTLGVYPMDFDQADRYLKVILRTDFERDEKGLILYNQKTGDPSRRFVATAEEEIGYAIELLAYVKNLQDEGEKRIEFHTDREADRPAIVAFLKELNATVVDLDADGQEFVGRPGQVRAIDAPADEAGKRPAATKQVTEPIYKTVIRESGRLRREINERLRKNS
jgi:hypothetical protein